MKDLSQKLPEGILRHLKGVIASSGLPFTEETLEALVKAWVEKQRMFEGQTRALDMQDARDFRFDDPRGVLLLTYSGSLVSLGPLEEAGRHVEYASIHLRTDVPHLVRVERVKLESGLVQHEAATLLGGPIRKTSPLLKIAVCAPEVPPEEQVVRIREATLFLTDGFARINRTIALPAAGLPERFTTKSIVAWIARKNSLSQKQVRQLVEDYLTMLESGMLLGQRVPAGRMGWLFLKKQPARKARVGINPATGEKLTLPARPEEPVPRMRFSRLMKDRARLAKP
jgi:nucleoid DNA-binding protein